MIFYPTGMLLTPPPPARSREWFPRRFGIGCLGCSSGDALGLLEQRAQNSDEREAERRRATSRKTAKIGRAAEREAQSKKTRGDEERKASKERERETYCFLIAVSALAPRPPVAHHKRTKPGLLGLGVAILTPGEWRSPQG